MSRKFGSMSCNKCGRAIIKVERWHRSYKPAELNAETPLGDRITWLKVAPGNFQPANHHQCPGQESDAEAKARRKRQREEQGILEPGEKPPKWRSQKGQFDMF